MLKLFMVALFFTSLPLAFGSGVEDEIREEVSEFIGESVDGVYDGVMSEVEIPKNDYINPTPEELENLKDEGVEWLDILMQLFGQTHSVAESGVHVVSDYDLDPWITGLIGVVVVVIIGIPLVKRLGMDLVKVILLSVSFVAVFAVIGLVF